MNMTAFLSAVDAIAAASPAYRLGHDGSDGLCDCIGLVIGAIRRAGGVWPGIHGSNWAARNAMGWLLPFVDAGDLTVGELVFKARSPGESGYALPDRYASDPDRADYYHVGVVRSVHPLKIVHCTTPGIVTDTAVGRWRFHGALSMLDEGEDSMSQTQTAILSAESGSTVNLRKTPGGALADRLPVGSTVTVIGRQEGWVQVSQGGKTGWVMAQYVRQDGEDTPADDSDAVGITLPRSLAEALRDALDASLGRG